MSSQEDKTVPNNASSANDAHTTSSTNATNATGSQPSASQTNPSSTAAQSTVASTPSAAGNDISPASFGLSMLEMLGIRAPAGTSTTSSQGPQRAAPGPKHAPHGTTGHSHAGHDGPSCPCCGTHQDDLWFQRCFTDERIFEFAVQMGATHPEDASNASASSSNQSRAQRRELKAQQLTPAQTKAALEKFSTASLTYEDMITGMDAVFGRFANMYYRIPAGATGKKGKAVLAAINLELLPNAYRPDDIGRPANLSKRLLKLGNGFWRDYFPSAEADAAVASLTSSSTTFWNTTAQREEGLPFMQIKIPDLKFVPASFTGFDWPVLYDLDHGFCWPLIDVSKLTQDDFMPWQNPRKAKYVAFAPCPTDPFDLGVPPNPQVSLSPAQHPHRVQKMIAIKDGKVTAFIDKLEKVDASLKERMIKVGLGTIPLANRKKVAGCIDCHKELTVEDTDVVVAPCGAFHVMHAACLKAHIMSLDILRYWTCPTCDKVLQENVGTDETGTQWLVPRPEPVRSLRDEIVRRERARV